MYSNGYMRAYSKRRSRCFAFWCLSNMTCTTSHIRSHCNRTPGGRTQRAPALEPLHGGGILLAQDRLHQLDAMLGDSLIRKHSVQLTAALCRLALVIRVAVLCDLNARSTQCFAQWPLCKAHPAAVWVLAAHIQTRVSGSNSMLSVKTEFAHKHTLDPRAEPRPPIAVSGGASCRCQLQQQHLYQPQ